MKTIGLIGGMSWESTIPYYKIINETVRDRLGGLHSAKILLYSVDFYEIEKCQSSGEWDRCGEMLAGIASRLEAAGADFIVICTNTMHKVVPQMERAIHIPILHIAEATAEELRGNHITKVALLGTKYTMTQDFYKAKLVDAGIEVLVPDSDEIELVNRIIFNELCLGVLTEQSKKDCLRIMEQLTGKGAQGVVLGCTELGLLIRQEDTQIPLFDTTKIHAAKAAEFAVREDRN